MRPATRQLLAVSSEPHREPHREDVLQRGRGRQKIGNHLQRAALGQSQGLVKSLLESSTGWLAILLLLCSEARKNLQEELLRKIKQNLDDRPSAAGCTVYFISLIGKIMYKSYNHGSDCELSIDPTGCPVSSTSTPSRDAPNTFSRQRAGNVAE